MPGCSSTLFEEGHVGYVDLGKFLHGTESERLAEAAATERICSQGNGFFFVRNHGVPQELIDRMYDVARKFHSLPQHLKLGIAANGALRGYTPPLGESASKFGDEHGPKQTASPGDLVEMFSMGHHVPSGQAYATNQPPRASQ